MDKLVVLKKGKRCIQKPLKLSQHPFRTLNRKEHKAVYLVDLRFNYLKKEESIFS